MPETIATTPITKKRSNDRQNLYRAINNNKTEMKLITNLIHRGIVKTQTLLYSEGGTADLHGLLFVGTMIFFLITLLLYCSHAAGIIHLPPSWVR